MDNEHLAHNENFPLEAAKDWIGRWKAAGGGFYFHPQDDGSVMVQLAATTGPAGTDPNSDHREPIQRELLLDPDLKSAVTTLAADAWYRMHQRAPAAATINLMDIEPAGHA